MFELALRAKFWCQCPGCTFVVEGDTVLSCGRRPTQEDGLCDVCRRNLINMGRHPSQV